MSVIVLFMRMLVMAVFIMTMLIMAVFIVLFVPVLVLFVTEFFSECECFAFIPF